MRRRGSRRQAAAALMCAALTVTLGACTAKADAQDAAPPSTAIVLANQKVGQACAYLAGAEQRPVGSEQAAVGQAMLAHAVTLALQAKTSDPRWSGFATDMNAVGADGGLPGLKRITDVCAKWKTDGKYYLTHTPTG